MTLSCGAISRCDLAHLAKCLNSVDLSEFQVEQDDVGLEGSESVFDTPHAVEFANDLDILLGVENVLHAVTHDRVVVHEQCANRSCRRI
jgi:hypothetical protein